MALRGYNSQVKAPQLKISMLSFSVVSDALVEGKGSFTLTKNGTGDYTLTLRNSFKRAPVVPAPSPATANLQVQVVSRAAGAVRFKFTNNSGTATDTDFSGIIVGSDDLTIRGA